MDKNFYNEASASKLGWKPDWFGAKYFDEELVEKIKEWQRANKLTADGLCGPSTHRRIYNERISNLEEHKPFKHAGKDESFIVMHTTINFFSKCICHMPFAVHLRQFIFDDVEDFSRISFFHVGSFG